jgi:VCBS repeat-containing protein
MPIRCRSPRSGGSNGAGTIGQALTGSYGTLTLNANGSYSYVSDANAGTGSHNDVFTYTVSDGQGGSATATLTVTIDPSGPGGNSANLLAANDFNGDGNSDMLWRHNSGLVGTWDMKNGQVMGTNAFASAPNDWHVQGTGDFNGDGNQDLLWRHNDGTVGIWDMDGAHVLGTHAFSNAPATGTSRTLATSAATARITSSGVTTAASSGCG